MDGAGLFDELDATAGGADVVDEVQRVGQEDVAIADVHGGRWQPVDAAAQGTHPRVVGGEVPAPRTTGLAEARRDEPRIAPGDLVDAGIGEGDVEPGRDERQPPRRAGVVDERLGEAQGEPTAGGIAGHRGVLVPHLAREVGDENTTVAGDSAGGGLALGLTQTLVDDAGPPGRLALIAPWLDIALTDPGVDEIARRDPWLVPAGLREAGRAWRGDLSPDDPRVSPLRGRVDGLPPTTVYIGDRDIFLPDALHLVDDIRATGGRVELVEQPGAVHAYPLTPTPEGRDASRRIVEEATR